MLPLAIAAGVLALGGIAFAVTGDGSGVAPGVEVAGVRLDVPEDVARRRLVARGGELVRRLVKVEYGGQIVTVMRPTDLGASPRVGVAVDVARRRAPGFWSRSWRRVSGGGDVASPLPVAYRPGALQQWIDDLAAQVDRPARSAKVVVSGTQLSVTPSTTGLRLDRSRLARTMSLDAATIPSTLHLPVEREEPGTSTAMAEASAAAGRQILARPEIVRVDGREEGLDPEGVARALRFEGGGARVDPVALKPTLSRAFGPLERQPRNARFVVRGRRVTIAPSQEGRLVDGTAVAKGLAGDDRPVEASIVTAAPTFTTDQARAMGIKELVGEFTTPFTSGLPRVTNIQTAARRLNGTIIPAGGTLSLNRLLGRRTRAKGYVEAPMIANGLDVDAVGGGVSQIATTLFNAAFFSGLDLVKHTAHQLYISRYPVGREATVSWRTPDLVIRNDWDAAVLIRAFTGPESVTVRMYSTSFGRRVETTTGQPYDLTEPETRLVVNPDLSPGDRYDVQPGGQGFSIDVTRKVYEGSRLRRDETMSTTYTADPHIIAVGPGTPGAETLPTPDG